MSLCSFYLAVRKQAREHLVDGTGHRPHYSLRTLCRALTYVASNPCNSVQRSLYEVGGHKHSVCSLLLYRKSSFGLNMFHVLLSLSISVGCADGFWCLQGFCMSFLTQLDRSSHPLVQKLVCQHILMGNTKCLKRVRSLSNSWQVLVTMVTGHSNKKWVPQSHWKWTTEVCKVRMFFWQFAPACFRLNQR